jgi:uncharacterized SAM-binding protein YcdF (DUF218 family)
MRLPSTADTGSASWHRVAQLLSVAVGATLIADALFLMSLRIFSLGVTLPLAIGCGLFLLGVRWRLVQAWLRAMPSRRRLWGWAWFGFWLWIVTVSVFWVVLARASSESEPTGTPPAVILVLGSGTPGGKVSPVLAARLDAAYARARVHPDALVVVSGGVDFNETRSEGAIMGDYLRAKGLDPRRIAQEEASSSTEQNLLFSRSLLAARGIVPGRIELVTSDFHTLRARWIAQRIGYTDVRMVGAATPLYVRYNAWLREYFAFASGFLLREY